MFGTNKPVTADAFFDREDILQRLSDAVRQLQAGSPKWLALIGVRRIGKTSLLLELARREHRQERLAFVVLDLLEETPLSPGVFRWYAARVVEALLGHEVGTSLSLLVGRPADFRRALQRAPSLTKLSEATRVILNELPDAKVDAGFVRAALSLPERLATELDLHVLVAIDEFQELAQLESKRGGLEPFPMMRSAWQRHERVGYVISGSARTMLTTLITSKRSPFFLHFDIVDVGPFSRANAEQLLIRGGVEPSLAVRSVDVLGGHPFYLQLIGEELVREPSPQDERKLKEVIQSLVFSRTGRLSLFFARHHDGLVGRSAMLSATLEFLADGALKPADLAKRLKAGSGDTTRYLERLEDAVEKGPDGRYRIVDSVFASWIRWRRPGGAVVPMSLVGDAAERAVAVHLAQLGFDLIYQSRASRGAFDLLATRGAKHLGIQVKRSRFPLRFKKTEWRRMEADSARLGWAWATAAVAEDDSVVMLDPGRAATKKEVRLGPDAEIENLLTWLETSVE